MNHTVDVCVFADMAVGGGVGGECGCENPPVNSTYPLLIRPPITWDRRKESDDLV